MARASTTDGLNGHRRSLLELAPLELDCMNTLWPMGEGTVREIRDRLAPIRPRAYTTIMTIMDRLARKGVVERRKVGRAYLYRPNLSADEARANAVGQVVENFFGGSSAALLAQLGGAMRSGDAVAPDGPEQGTAVIARAAAASAGTSGAPRQTATVSSGLNPAATEPAETPQSAGRAKREGRADDEESPVTRIDATLL